MATPKAMALKGTGNGAAGNGGGERKVRADGAHGAGKAADLHPDATAWALGLAPEVYQHYKMGEALAHIFPYQPLKTGDVVEVYIPEAKRTIKHNVYKLNVNHPGLVGYILCPLETAKELENKFDVKIIFRGTDLADIYSVQRNVSESGGSGHESFHTNAEAIAQQINIAFENLKRNLAAKKIDVSKVEFSITLAGHSLGAADAQRCKLLLMQAIAENSGYGLKDAKDVKEAKETKDSIPEHCRKHLSCIRKLRLFTFNGTGIAESDNLKAEHLAAWLKAKRDQKALTPLLEVFIFHADGDGIQQTGESHLLYRAPKEVAMVWLVKAANIYKGANFVTKQEAMKTCITFWMNMAKHNSKMLVVTGVAAGVGFYTGGLGWSALYTGGGALIGSGLKLKNWVNMLSSAYSVAMGGWGTVQTHTTCYFSEDYSTLEARKLQHYFSLWRNEVSADHVLIKDEIGRKHSLAVGLQKSSSLLSRVICRRTHRHAASEDLSKQVSLHFQFVKTDTRPLSQHLSRQAAASAAAAAAAADVAHHRRVRSATSSGFA